MNKDTLRQVFVILATLVTVTVNGLANALPINGQNTGQISDRFDVLFVPAGYVFAIWGLIYRRPDRLHDFPGAAGAEREPAAAQHRLDLRAGVDC